jgi:O-antigen/teichoic acid export membrane protein
MVRGGAWLATANALGAGLLVVQGVVLTRGLGATGLGTVAIVVAAVTVARLVLSFRMGDVIVRYVAEALAAREPGRAAAWIKAAALVETVTALAAWLLVMLLARTAAGWFMEPLFAPLITLYAVVIPATIVSETSLGVLQVFRRFDLQALIQTLERVVTLAAVIVASLSGGGLVAYVMASAAGPVAGAMALAFAAWLVAARELGERFHAAPLAPLAGRRAEALKFAASTNAAATLSLATKDADALWLGWLRTPVEAGLYRLAYNVGTLLYLPVAPLSQTVYPEAARLAAEGHTVALRRLIVRSTWPIALYAAIIVALAAGFGGPVLGYVYGPEFADAAPALTIILAGAGIGAVTFWARPLVLAAGGAGLALVATALAAAAKIAIVLLLVPRLGFVMNAWGLLAAYGVGAAVLVWRVRGILARSRAPVG